MIKQGFGLNLKLGIGKGAVGLPQIRELHGLEHGSCKSDVEVLTGHKVFVALLVDSVQDELGLIPPAAVHIQLQNGYELQSLDLVSTFGLL